MRLTSLLAEEYEEIELRELPDTVDEDVLHHIVRERSGSLVFNGEKVEHVYSDIVAETTGWTSLEIFAYDVHEKMLILKVGTTNGFESYEITATAHGSEPGMYTAKSVKDVKAPGDAIDLRSFVED